MSNDVAEIEEFGKRWVKAELDWGYRCHGLLGTQRLLAGRAAGLHLG